ncbi:pol [Symbiodinium sp. CCMP2592]|nr:pol [Symbiodinium sp. CCMP2592]
MNDAACVPIDVDGEDADLEGGDHSPTEIAEEEDEDKDVDNNVNIPHGRGDDPGQRGGDEMQVDIHLGALGELNEGDQLGDGSGGGENRKRGRSQVKQETEREGEEGEEESPSKRASILDSAPNEKEIKETKGRTTAAEKHLHDLKAKVELHDDRITEVTASLARLQSDLNSRSSGTNATSTGVNSGPQFDPWANWRQNQPKLQKQNGHLPRAQMGDFEENGQLTEEEKRTLIVGGWAQDTKKSTIEAEVDEPVLAVFGPRRSVGNLKFDYRQNESFQSLRDRMWKTMKAIREMAIQFPSTKDIVGSKPAWASFVKTKEARRRTMLVSQVRRVCMQLAMDSTSDQGGPCRPNAINAESYDTDWGNGTVWHESHKIASATHRQPNPNTSVILMPGGWVDLKAVIDVTGCTETEARGAFERELRVSQWNLGGQDVKTLDVVLHGCDFVCAQEVARNDAGWREENDDIFYWLHHRHDKQYRGVAVGFAHDLLDCIIEKVACERGIWVLARIKGLGRVVFGSLHAHTGTTHGVYKAAIQEFFAKFKNKWRQWPIILGVDANEQPTWDPQEDGTVNVIEMSLNLQSLTHEAFTVGLRAVAPGADQLQTPTHYPRDETRQGRQIDMVFVKQVITKNVEINPELRHCIGSDHACLQVLLPQRRAVRQAWGNDSRPRRLISEVGPHEVIVDVEDVCKLAKSHTAPIPYTKYEDPPELKDMIQRARSSNDRTLWKKVHDSRRKHRRRWKKERLEKALQGDWGAFRAHQRDRRRTKGWWGRLLQDLTSEQVTHRVQQHLEEKLVNKNLPDWSHDLWEQIQQVPLPQAWVPATREELCEEVNKMKRNVSVGPDGISVDLLVHLLYNPELGQQLTDLVNHIISTNEQQHEWGVSFLALLAKCTIPEEPKDLRPICMSSSFSKLVNRVIIGRLFPTLRRGSKISSCGRGRQSADLIGSLSRIRDVVREWDESILVVKLDIAGAFDKISRQKVVDLILARTAGTNLGYEVRYLLGQLDVFVLQGKVPGGDTISVNANSGIKQGAPESAELFGLIMGWILDETMSKPAWQAVGAPFHDLDLELMYFQDDVFLLETSAARVARKIEMLKGELAQAGLFLAMNKTKIVASPAYHGKMSLVIDGQVVEIYKNESLRALGVSFNFSASVGQQAHELLGRARAAFAEHRELLMSRGSWEKKLSLVETLIMSTWRWCAGAIHWPQECLAQANTLQAHILRTAFRLRRGRGEDWVAYNSRTLRFVRQFLVQRHVPRWSSVILRLQHALHGHWARRVETFGPHGQACLNISMRAITWRDLRWWRGEQAKTTTGRKHPRPFYACNPERNIAESIGTSWANIALDRAKWSRHWVSQSGMKLSGFAELTELIGGSSGSKMDANFMEPAEQLEIPRCEMRLWPPDGSKMAGKLPGHHLLELKKKGGKKHGVITILLHYLSYLNLPFLYHREKMQTRDFRYHRQKLDRYLKAMFREKLTCYLKVMNMSRHHREKIRIRDFRYHRQKLDRYLKAMFREKLACHLKVMNMSRHHGQENHLLYYLSMRPYLYFRNKHNSMHIHMVQVLASWMRKIIKTKTIWSNISKPTQMFYLHHRHKHYNYLRATFTEPNLLYCLDQPFYLHHLHKYYSYLRVTIMIELTMLNYLDQPFYVYPQDKHHSEYELVMMIKPNLPRYLLLLLYHMIPDSRMHHRMRRDGSNVEVAGALVSTGGTTGTGRSSLRWQTNHLQG